MIDRSYDFDSGTSGNGSAVKRPRNPEFLTYKNGALGIKECAGNCRHANQSQFSCCGFLLVGEKEEEEFRI